METQKISFLWERINERALEVAKLYQNAVNDLFKNEKYGTDEYFCGAKIGMHSDFDKVESIGESVFTCSFEYNFSCHCHPEYTRYEIAIPTSLLEYDFEGEYHNRFEAEDWEEFDNDTPKELLKNRISAILIEAKRKRDGQISAALEEEAKIAEKAKEKAKIEKEKRDREKYEELKKKFG